MKTLAETLRDSVEFEQWKRSKTMHIVKAETHLTFTPEQESMIRDTFANGASAQEFAVLIEVARARGLNPLLRQIHFVERWDSNKKRMVWSCQVSIDGLRAIAQRTGAYDGQDEPEYAYDDKGHLVSAKQKVYRKDWSRPVVGVAYFAEYVQRTKEGKPTRFWATMPHVMLAKCAEALAFRKAFPEDTSGLYTPEEMGQSTNDAPRLPRITPEDDPIEGHAYDDLPEWAERLTEIEEYVDANGDIAELRDMLGSKARPNVGITAELQAANISPSYRSALGKTWQRINRKLAKREAAAESTTTTTATQDDNLLLTIEEMEI